MDHTPTAQRAPALPEIRAALVIAVAGSAMAALVHAAAVGAHEGDRLLTWMFACAAVAQLGWAASAAARPTNRVLALGLLINGGAIAVWALTRTAGIGFVEPLALAQEVGTPDLAAAVFAGVSVSGSLMMLANPVAGRILRPAWLGLFASFALLAALPAMAAEHAHPEDSSHGHADEVAAGEGHDDGHGSHAEVAGVSLSARDDHSTDDHTTDGMSDDHASADDAADHASAIQGATAHGAENGHQTHATTPTTGPSAGTHDPNEHASPPTTSKPGTTTPTTSPHQHPTTPTTTPSAPTGPIISLTDPRVTAAQRAVAQQLIDEARAGMSRFTTEATVTAAGYVSIGDGGTDGYEHFINWPYLLDGVEFDANRIEAIVMKKRPGLPKQIVSAMYILNLDKTMATAPALAGPLTTFHDHQNLCFDGQRLVGLAQGGVCARGTLLPTPPMLHVWMVEHPCGPFAGIETHGGGGCGHDDH